MAPSRSRSHLLGLHLNPRRVLPLPPTTNLQATPLQVLILLRLNNTPTRLLPTLVLPINLLRLDMVLRRNTERLKDRPRRLTILALTIPTPTKRPLRPRLPLNRLPTILTRLRRATTNLLPRKATLHPILLHRKTILPTAALLPTPTLAIPLNKATTPLLNNIINMADMAIKVKVDKAETSNSKEKVVLLALATGSALLVKTTTSHGVLHANNATFLVRLLRRSWIATNKVVLLDATNVIPIRTPMLPTTGTAPSVDLGTLASVSTATTVERPNLTANPPTVPYATLEAKIALDPTKEVSEQHFNPSEHRTFENKPTLNLVSLLASTEALYHLM